MILKRFYLLLCYFFYFIIINSSCHLNLVGLNLSQVESFYWFLLVHLVKWGTKLSAGRTSLCLRVWHCIDQLTLHWPTYQAWLHPNVNRWEWQLVDPSFVSLPKHSFFILRQNFLIIKFCVHFLYKFPHMFKSKNAFHM